MKLLVLSDLHLELGSSFHVPPDLEYDIAVLAGNIHNPGTEAVHWAQRESTFGGRPVILVPGNHEFYGRCMGVELAAMRKAAEGSNVHVLDRESVVIDGVRFLGCTLWTDFMLPVGQEDGSVAPDLTHALDVANRRLSDFQLIDVPHVDSFRPDEPTHRKRRRRLRAEDTIALHWMARDWLLRQIARPSNEPTTVIVTHHAPTIASVAPRYGRDWLTAAFVSDLPAQFFAGVDLWIHGHTHSPFDYLRRTCRVVSNPRGYHRRDGGFENTLFEPRCIIDPGRLPQHWQVIIDLNAALRACGLGKDND